MDRKMPELFILPNPEAAPFYTTKALDGENAGVDLFVPNDVEFAPGERKMVSMGVRAVMVDWKKFANYWMLPRSSMSKTGLMLMNSVGVIDKSYRGELIAALWNTTNDTVKVSAGQRLVQIVARDMDDIKLVTVVDELPGSVSERGEGGFGSTGL
jgi:dUTP pyrophosphatase